MHSSLLNEAENCTKSCAKINTDSFRNIKLLFKIKINIVYRVRDKNT